MKTEVLKVSSLYPDPDKLERAAEVLKKGGLVAFPTETVYGLGANFQDESAIEKVYRAKRRPRKKPLTVHIANINYLRSVVGDISKFESRLIRKFWPGPLTLIFRSKEGKKIGFRMPSNRIAQDLINKAGIPIVAPSANISGGPPPKTAEEVLSDLDGRIDMVIDGGPTQVGTESTVIDLTTLPPKVLRSGAIDPEDIFNLKNVLIVCTGNSCRSPMAEGLLRKKLKEKKLDRRVDIFSVGVVSCTGLKASSYAISVMKEEGIDISKHESRPLTDDLIEDADLIFAMEEHHKDVLVKRVKESADRIYVLNIPDPMGKPIEVYRNTLTMLKDSLPKILEKLL